VRPAQNVASRFGSRPGVAKARPAAEARRPRGAPIGLALGALCGVVARDLGIASYVTPRHEHFWLVVAGALLGELCWRTRLRPLINGAALLSGLLWFTVAFTPLSAWIAPALERRDPPGSADAVYVLGSSIQRDGEFTSQAMSRFLHGLELLGEGWSTRLVIPEFPPPRASNAAPAQSLLRRLGLDRDLVVIGPARTTREEAVAVAALCRARGWRRILVVTSPLHSGRAAAAFERAGIEVISSPSTETDFDVEQLDRSDDRINACASILSEILSLCMYRWRGWA
jgi:uncharacterized SAM-binding protein YcdF (DUF218 family)